jgi:hypothetical protein
VCAVSTYTTVFGSSAACPSIPVGSIVIAQPPEYPAVFLANSTIVVATIDLSVPYSQEEFTADVELSIRYSIALTLEISSQFVQVIVMNRRSGINRRLLTLALEAEAKVPADKQDILESKMASQNFTTLLNDNFATYGLQPALVVSTKTDTIIPSATDILLSRLTSNGIQIATSRALGVNATVLIAPSILSDVIILTSS